MDVTPVEIDLSEYLRDIVGALESKRSDVRVTTDLPASTALRTDEEVVTLAVESALENALEHAESSVTVGVEKDTNGCVITIADDGPGIPEEELVPIETRTETDLQHGTGFGLWQLRWSVDKPNGELSFETGEGTTVRITIPDRDTSGHAQ